MLALFVYLKSLNYKLWQISQYNRGYFKISRSKSWWFNPLQCSQLCPVTAVTVRPLRLATVQGAAAGCHPIKAGHPATKGHCREQTLSRSAHLEFIGERKPLTLIGLIQTQVVYLYHLASILCGSSPFVYSTHL